jgi:hypothetical protein
MADVLEFKTTLKERQVTIDGKLYTIKELNGEGLSKTRGALENAEITVNPNGTSSFKNMNLEGQEIDLLCLCLFDEEGVPVPRKIIATWPCTVISDLHDIAQELSGLNKEAREKVKAEAKND